MKRTLPALALIALAVGAWQLYLSFHLIDRLVLPGPTDVASALWNDSGLLWSNFRVTAAEILLGIATALVAALVLASAVHVWRPLRSAVYPLLIVSQTIPILIVAPLLLIWLGLGLAPKVVLIALVCFFPLVVSTLDGLAAVEPELLKMVRTLGATRRQAFFRVEAPSALPATFSGARVAVTWAVVGGAVAEYSGASTSGLGHLILQASGQLQTARAGAAVMILSMFALALFGAVTLAERRLLPWTPGVRP
jgi:ABC-type nitrate/sulfonate/bicarbonate transport system permease component